MSVIKAVDDYWRHPKMLLRADEERKGLRAKPAEFRTLLAVKLGAPSSCMETAS